MNIVLWIIQILLGITFLGSGITKLARPRLALVGRLPYVADFSDSQVKGIGTLALLAAVGLILLMGGAIATHARRREPQMVAVNVVLLVLAAVVAIARFGPYPF